MNRVIKEIDYPIMGMTISLLSALNYNVIGQIGKETKLTLGIFIVLMVRTPGQVFVLAPTKLQTDSTGLTLESVIHIGCSSLPFTL